MICKYEPRDQALLISNKHAEKRLERLSVPLGGKADGRHAGFAGAKILVHKKSAAKPTSGKNPPQLAWRLRGHPASSACRGKDRTLTRRGAAPATNCAVEALWRITMLKLTGTPAAWLSRASFSRCKTQRADQRDDGPRRLGIASWPARAPSHRLISGPISRAFRVPTLTIAALACSRRRNP